MDSWTQGIVTVLGGNPWIQVQRTAKSLQQFLESPDLVAGVTDAMRENQETNNRIVEFLFSLPNLQIEFSKNVGELAYEECAAQRRSES